jgi:hypothetical protein
MASGLRAPSTHRNLDPDKIQPKAVGKSPSQRVLPGDSCHAETPATLSSHSTRIEQAPNLPDPLGVRKHYHNSPTLCQTTYMPRARHNRMDNTTDRVLCAPRTRSTRAAAGSRETLVAMRRTYLCYHRTCVRYCCPPRSLGARTGRPKWSVKRQLPMDPCLQTPEPSPTTRLTRSNPRKFYRKLGREHLERSRSNVLDSHSTRARDSRHLRSNATLFVCLSVRRCSGASRHNIQPFRPISEKGSLREDKMR